MTGAGKPTDGRRVGYQVGDDPVLDEIARIIDRADRRRAAKTAPTMLHKGKVRPALRVIEGGGAS